MEGWGRRVAWAFTPFHETLAGTLFVALPFSPAFLVNDPDHAPFGAAWLRGITPARVAVLAAVCFFVAFPAVRIFILSGEYGEAMWQLWDNFARRFAGAAPMFILVIKVESWTAAAPTRARLGALVLAVVAGAAIYTALRTGMRFFHGTVDDPAVFWETMVAFFARSLVTGALLTVDGGQHLRNRVSADRPRPRHVL